jgi:ABC-type multidrug transport system ATPase subunit
MNGCSDRPAGLTVTQGRATLLITHDLDGLDQVDEIVLLDHGRVAARGTHTELLRTDGLYRQMWQSSHPTGDDVRACIAVCWEHDQTGRMTCPIVSMRW